MSTTRKTSSAACQPSGNGKCKPTKTKSKSSLSMSRRNETKPKPSSKLKSSVRKEDDTNFHKIKADSDKSSTFLGDQSISQKETISPADVSTEDTDGDDLAGLKFCSQENGLDASYDNDGQCEVRWDCYSPETVKQLKKLRGQYSAEGVKRIVANFNDAHVKPQTTSTLKLMPLPGPGPSTAFKEVSIPHRATSKRPQRATTRKAVQEMILLLQGRVAKQAEAEAAAKTGSEEVSINGCVDKNNAGDNKMGADDDCWSDDDLFQDNSFLIEATQNPEKFINTSVDVSSAVANKTNFSLPETSLAKATTSSRLSDERHWQSSSPNSSFIPSSYAGKQFVAPGKPVPPPAPSAAPSHTRTGPQPAKPSVIIVKKLASSNQRSNNSRVQPSQHVPPNKSTNSTASSFSSKMYPTSFSNPNNAYSAKFTSSVNKFANQNTQKPLPQNSQHTTIQNSQQHISQLPLGAKVKTSFRKFNSFQVDGRPGVSRSNNSTSSNQSPSSVLNSSFKRTMSFDSSCSSTAQKNFSVIKPTGSGPTSLSTLDKKSLAKTDSKSSASKTAPPKGNVGSSVMSPPAQLKGNNQVASRTDPLVSPSEDGFDLSLTDDMLQQLLEVDEVFDSQADILASCCPATTTASTHSGGTSNFLSPSTNKKTELRPVSALSSVTSLRSSTPVRPFKQRSACLEPNSSTPAKLARPTDTAVKDPAASDSGMELFDSFLNEEMYETQILPILEKIESETSSEKTHPAETAPLTTVFPPSPVKCSPEEIEQKRQAALQRRSLRLSQITSKTSSR